jgi:hypothetical protein
MIWGVFVVSFTVGFVAGAICMFMVLRPKEPPP